MIFIDPAGLFETRKETRRLFILNGIAVRKWLSRITTQGTYCDVQ
jgi:hypothetical protein